MTKTRRRVNNKRKTQKIWKMRGCAKKIGGGCGCGVKFGGYKKGKRRSLRGGRIFLSPSPFVNSPSLPAQIQTWPGVQGSSTGNWLTKNQHLVDVTDRTAIQERGGQVFPLQMGGMKGGCGCGLQTGGMKTKKGGTFPGLVNMGNSFGYGVHSAYSNLIGAASMPVNPLPTADQFQKNN